MVIAREQVVSRGCLARAVRWSAGAVAAGTVLGGLGLWGAWRLLRQRAVFRAARAIGRGYRRVRHPPIGLRSLRSPAGRLRH